MPRKKIGPYRRLPAEVDRNDGVADRGDIALVVKQDGSVRMVIFDDRLDAEKTPEESMAAFLLQQKVAALAFAATNDAIMKKLLILAAHPSDDATWN